MNVFIPGVEVEEHPGMPDKTVLAVFRRDAANIVRFITKSKNELLAFLERGEGSSWDVRRLDEEYTRFGIQTRMQMATPVQQRPLARSSTFPRGGLL